VLHGYPWGTVELHPFLCELADPVREPVAHEHSALQWVEKSALLGFDLAPADVPIVEWLQADILKLPS
jgi:hypothetical protein